MSADERLADRGGLPASVHYSGHGVTIHHGDCLDMLAGLDACSVDAVVTDPPYELGMMGKAWDGTGVAFDPATWEAVLRVLKPGGHLVAFGGTRAWHRMVCAIEDAGFDIRDSIAWLYGEGMPKGFDIGKSIDGLLLAGNAHTASGNRVRPDDAATWTLNSASHRPYNLGALGERKYTTSMKRETPGTPEGAIWQGWNTSLRPSHEPISVARKPPVGTIASNVLTYGVGGVNVEAARIDIADPTDSTVRNAGAPQRSGRWPANAALDGYAAAIVNDQQAGAARFFYASKAHGESPEIGAAVHPTVKPLNLMRWLIRLVTPPGGVVLDPFAGSGTTAEACLLEGFRCIAIEREADYLPLIVARITRQRDPVAHIRLADSAMPTLFDEETH